MTGAIEVIKRVAVAAVEAKKPVNIFPGTVISTSPVKIQLAQNQIYGKEFFLALDSLPTLKTGDVLLLLRVQGGQQFLILGKRGDL